uniref:Uncharacterized protein n=1 Tax=Anguilla anguilla TaxID=7936 RepID=A0A0E9XJR3_ANGAN
MHSGNKRHCSLKASISIGLFTKKMFSGHFLRAQYTKGASFNTHVHSIQHKMKAGHVLVLNCLSDNS